MVYETIKMILCRDTEEQISIGDIVNITTENGGDYGSCEIVKITSRLLQIVNTKIRFEDILQIEIDSTTY